MGAAIAVGGGSNYSAETPRRRTALAVLLIHILLLLLLLTLQPPEPLLPPLRVEANPISIRPIEEPVVVPLDPVERAAPRTRDSEVQRPFPDAPRPPSPFERRATEAPGNPSPAAGSPAPMPSPVPTPYATPALGQSAVLGTGGTTNGSGTGIAGTGGTGAGGRGGGAGAGDGGGGGGAAGIATARWAFMMRYERLLSFYPPEARRARIDGRVTLVCRVRLNKSVHSCEVEQEVPAGLGFGRAAMRASREFQVHPRRVNGRAVNDGLVRIPIRFEVPEITRASN